MWRVIVALVLALTSVGLSASPVMAAVTLSPGDLVVADSNGAGGPGIAPAGSGRIIKVDPNTGAQTLISSGGMLDYPWAVAIDAAGKIIVLQTADSYGKPTSTGSVLKVDPNTGAQTLISSGGYFHHPMGLVIDSAGNIIVADQQAFGGTGGLIKVNPTTGTQTIIASGGEIRQPSGVTIDAAGNLYVTSATASGGLPWVVVRVNPTNGAQTVIASVNIQAWIGGLVIDPTGNIFVTEIYYQNGIIKIPADGSAATWLSSRNNFQDPWGITLDAAGYLVTADGNWFGEGKVIRVNPATGAQTLVSSGGLLVDPSGVAEYPIVANQLPFALFTYSPAEPKVNQKVTFNASAAYDPDGTIVSYSWEFGDGGTGTGVIVEHTYTNANEYSVILTVTDNGGGTDAEAKTITVAQPSIPPAQGRRSLPDPSTFIMVGSGLASALLYIGFSRLRRRLNRG